MKRIVIIRVRQQDQEPFCLLISGDDVEPCIDNPELFMEATFPEVQLLAIWEVPKDLSKMTVDGGMRNHLDAIVGLDVLGNAPVVSDLLAYIFEAGCKLGESKQS